MRNDTVRHNGTNELVKAAGTAVNYSNIKLRNRQKRAFDFDHAKGTTRTEF